MTASSLLEEHRSLIKRLDQIIRQDERNKAAQLVRREAMLNRCCNEHMDEIADRIAQGKYDP